MVSLIWLALLIPIPEVAIIKPTGSDKGEPEEKE